MHLLVSLTVACCVVLAGCYAVADDRPSPTGGAIAVVELFTSEGCSSCPPADAALADLVANADTKGLPVFPIAFHVDYWNHLGWRDPFSSAAASDRQARYARGLPSQVYTPQMVVNGRSEFVGSDRAAARRAIDAALATPAAVKVSASTERKGNDVAVRYTLDRVPADAVLNIVAIERGLSTNIPRGENAGRVLKHENVARAEETVRLTRTDQAVDGKATLHLPADAKSENLRFIVYLQDGKSLGVLGATQVK